MSLKEVTAYQSGGNVFGAYRQFNALIPLAGVEHYKFIKVFHSKRWEADFEGDFILTTVNYCVNRNSPDTVYIELFKRESHNDQNYDIPIWSSLSPDRITETTALSYGGAMINVPIQNQRIIFTSNSNNPADVIFFELVLKTVVLG